LFNSLGGFFGFITNAYLSDRLGRRMVFRLFGAGFVLTSSIYLFAPLGSSFVLLALFGMIYGFHQFGLYASFGPYFTELFPTELRGNGQAFSYNFGRAASSFFIMAVATLAATMPLSTAMAMLGVTGIAVAMIATMLLPETAGRELTSLADGTQA
jgi:MFS family permease